MSRRRRPRFYFSLRSPYSWLAYRELLDKYADVAAQVDWVPFFEPDERSDAMLTERGGVFPYAQMSRAKHLYVLQDVKRLADVHGVPVTWPVDRDPVWEVPHLGYLVAERAGKGPEYIAAAYQARWEQGRDICDPATVADIAERLGLDADEVSGAAERDEMREQGIQVLLEICKDGVFGVPFFVNGFSRYWGLDRLATFARDLRASVEPAKAMPEPVPAAVALGRASDHGHAGGCG